MKKMIAIVAMVAVAALTGCSKIENNIEDNKDADKAWCYHGMGSYSKAVEIEGHQYILMRSYHSCSIVHAASCECMKKQAE